MRTRQLWRGAPVLAAAVALGTAMGASALAGQQDNSVIYAQSTSITDLGPAFGAFQKYPAGYEASFALYDRLVTFDENMEIQPQLAESWEASEDGKSMTFTLREGVVFHDGTPFDAEAVVFNIERMMDPEVNTTNRPLWDPIAGAEALDARTVRITTEEPYAMLLNTLAHGSGAIVSPAAVEAKGMESLATEPVGAGPFKLDSFSPGQELVLTAFEDYWGGRPALDKVVYRFVPEAATRISALRTGEVDVIDSIPLQLIDSLKKDENVEVVTKPGLRPMGLAILTTKEPWDEVEVRKALNHAVPVEALSERVFFGYARPSDSPLAFNTSGHAAIGGYDYDPQKAKELLSRAGFEDSDGDGVLERDGEPLTMRLLTSEGNFPNDVQTSEIAARAFQEIGIDVTIAKVESGSYWDALRLEEEELDWDLALFGFNPSNAAGHYHLDSMFRSNPDNAARPAVWNMTRYTNPAVDRLLDEARATVEPAAHGELLGQAQEIIWDEAPYVWLHVNDIASAKRAELDGVEVWPIVFTIVHKAHW